MSQSKGWFRLNNKRVALVLLLCAGLVQAALPPQFQNEKDLDVMLSYVKSHPEVLSGLQAIDLGLLTIYYGEGCSAEFSRKKVERPEGWTGPAEPLVLMKNHCPEETTTAGLDLDDDLGSITSRVTGSCGAEITEAKEAGCKISAE